MVGCMKNVLVTGGAGFIGSNFIQYLLEHEDEICLVNLDLLTYAGNLENLQGCENDPRHHFVKGDVRDRALLDKLFAQYDFDTVVHFAAESHVDRSITEPEVFLTTNILGTQATGNSSRIISIRASTAQMSDICRYRPTRSMVRWVKPASLQKRQRLHRTAHIRPPRHQLT